MKITVVFCALTTLVEAVPINLDEKSQEKEREKLHLASEPTVANVYNSVDSKLAVNEHQVMKPNPYATHHVYNFNDRSAQEMAEYQDHWSNIFLHAQQQRLPISPVADLLPSYNLKQMMPQDMDSSEHRSVSQDIRKPGFEYNIILCNSYSCMPDSLKVRGSDLWHSYNLKLAIPWDADSEMYPTYRNVRSDIRIPGFRNRDIPWIRRYRQATFGWSEEWCMPFDRIGEVALLTDVDSERFGIPSPWSRAIVYIPYIVAPLPLPGTIAPPAWWCRCIDDDYIYYLK